MDHTMQLAFFTDFEYRVQVVDQILMERGWQLLAGIGQPQPTQWLLQQHGVDVVLIDLDLPNAISVVKELAQMLPHLPIVALATPRRVVELQDAMSAGAANFIAFSIDVKQLLATLERVDKGSQRFMQLAVIPYQSAHTYAAQPGPGRRQHKLIVVTSLKGGVGCSTLAANLAVALHQRSGGDVVRAEAHHGLGHLALLLNLYPRHTIESLDGESNIDSDLLRGLLQTHSSGIRLLVAPMDPSHLVELPVEVWQQTMRLLQETADCVVVDTAAHADGLLSELLAQDDEILLVTGPDIAALRDARILLETLRQATTVEGQIHIVLNRAGSQGGIDERVVQAQLHEPVAASILEDTALATFAFNRGVPFIVSHPRSSVSRRLQTLADGLINEGAFAAGQAPAQRSSLFSFLNLVR